MHRPHCVPPAQEMAEKIREEYARIANVRYVHFDDARLTTPVKALVSSPDACPSSEAAEAHEVVAPEDVAAPLAYSP